MKTSAMMLCPRCLKTSELDNLHLLDQSFKLVWVGLTDEERKKIVGSDRYTDLLEEVVKIVEAKLKEKNT